MESPAPPAPPPSIYQPARWTGCELTAWIVVGLGIFFTLYHNLLAALLAGLFVYSLVHRIAGHLTDYKVEGGRAKVFAMLIVSVLLVGISTVIVLALIGLVRGRIGDLPQMIQQITGIVEHFRPWFDRRGIGEKIPDAQHLHTMILHWLREHSAAIQKFRDDTPGIALHALIGILIGSLLSFHTAHSTGPLSAAFFERCRRVWKAFEQVVFAQVKISALNTVFTSIYLLVILPLFGIHLPFRATLIGITFVAGLVPVVGNLVSNAVIVLISLGAGPGVAGGSLAFLVIIHKLEYFLNAKIVGTEIKASAWEILLAMLCFEAAFGIPGVIIAPIVYAYVKAELRDKLLI